MRDNTVVPHSILTDATTAASLSIEVTEVALAIVRYPETSWFYRRTSAFLFILVQADQWILQNTSPKIIFTPQKYEIHY